MTTKKTTKKKAKKTTKVKKAKKVTKKTTKKVTKKAKKTVKKATKVKKAKKATKKVTKKATKKAKKTVKKAKKVTKKKATKKDKEIPLQIQEKIIFSDKETLEIIANVISPDAVPLVEKLLKEDNYSEFKLAEDLGAEVNIIRRVLYSLLHANLVTFTRKKDKQKGWYIYYWTLNRDQIPYLVEKSKRMKLERLQERLKREQDTIFFRSDYMRVSFEQAVEFGFKCPECGDILVQEDNSPIIKRIEDQIKELKKELEKK